MRVALLALIAVMAVGQAGCELSKPYITKVDRQDQVLDTGNRGYLLGTPPPAADRGELKRPFLTVDIDLPSLSGAKTAETKVARPETGANISRGSSTREEDIK